MTLLIDNPPIGEQVEVLSGLESVVEQNLNLLAPIDKAWQPTDLLPDLSSPDWQEELAQFREAAQQLSDEILVVLVADMVTEEALPNYAISLNLVARDDAGDSPKPWARWMRGWSAEENRHGDLLNAYLRLSGRVDMRAVELTVHNLIANGFNPRSFPDLYAGIIYTSFQERATKVSHANVGRMVAAAGDENLARICKRIAGDESRHELFYTRMMGEVMNQDPARGIIVFNKMMRKIIAMPGRLMYDGKDPDLFEHFAVIAQRLGVYTTHDYADIFAHLVKTWAIADRSVSGRAAAAQENLCAMVERLASAAEAVSETVLKQPPTPFSWIHDRMA
jgi:acyl-[acyl-carrier-protein] desaturase